MKKNKGYQSLEIIVLEKIKEMILDGTLRLGEQIIENDIAIEISVNRTKVREAVLELEKEGYMEYIPKKGYFITNVTKEDILEVLEIRVVLEGLAAELAASRISDEAKEKLTYNLKAFDNARETLDRRELTNLDKKFHNIIYQEAGNSKLFYMISNIQDKFQKFRLTYFNEFDDYIDLQTSHEKLYKAIMANDAEKSKKAAIEHIEDIKGNFIKWIGANNE